MRCAFRQERMKLQEPNLDDPVVGANATACGRIPQTNRTVPGAGYNPRTIWRKGN